ncbi:hypothetical protein [Algibacter sp. L3A6]|uniref:hypothetical protein n=1 Tax=Algibacter sp. L3A6 TaxID=2686366 RepID=UPI00131CBF0A|nr:hypothetical protein [Algibacter sp. L3A6]
MERDVNKGNTIYSFLKLLKEERDMAFAFIDNIEPNASSDYELIDYIKENDLIKSKKGEFSCDALVYITQNGRNVLEHNSWEDYIKSKNNAINESYEIEKERQEQKDEIDRLTKVNLELQNKQMKRYVVYSIIAFVLGAIITNVKDILILLHITNQQ